jgi:hypothetical protein
VIKTLVASTDPSVAGVEAPCSYMLSESVYGYPSRRRLDKITDGTSNTIAIAEGYTKCEETNRTDYARLFPTTYTAGSYYSSATSYTREWNYDPYASVSTSTTTSSSSGTRPNRLYVYDSSTSGKTYPRFGSSGDYDDDTRTTRPFAVKPPVDDCHYLDAQATTSGGLLVGLADGSTKIVSPHITMAVWRAVCSPASGDVIGAGW